MYRLYRRGIKRECDLNKLLRFPDPDDVIESFFFPLFLAIRAKNSMVSNTIGKSIMHALLGKSEKVNILFDNILFDKVLFNPAFNENMHY